MARACLDVPSIQPPVLAGVSLGSLDPLIRREMRNREVHTPPISTFRWWARRSHVLFGTILDAAAERWGPPLSVVDPFAGGGTTVLEAVRRGHAIHAQDINPWAVRGMHAMLSLGEVAPGEFDRAADELAAAMRPVLERAYRRAAGWTAHVLRVATLSCPRCDATLWLYPYALITLDSRRPDERRGWFGCPRCGRVTRGSRRHGVTCEGCGEHLSPDDLFLRARRAACRSCGAVAALGDLLRDQALGHRMVLVERCEGERRWFSTPGAEDLDAEVGWSGTGPPFGDIPPGKETRVLLRHGFRRWADLYPPRQRVVLASLLASIDALGAGEAVREALTLAAVGTAEMAGFASRWDRYYLKAYEATANHRFALVPFSAEPNVWGCRASGRGTFIRRLRQFRRTLAWWGAREGCRGRATVVAGPSQRMPLEPASVDLVLTDPPYFGDVQYGELSRLFEAWLGAASGERSEEVVVDGAGKGGGDYTRLLGAVFADAARVLRPGGRMILTFHNRTARAYAALAEALGQAGFGVVTWAWAASENERDMAKRNRSACTMDLILECAAGRAAPAVPPTAPPARRVEAHFLWTAGGQVAGMTQGAISAAALVVRLEEHPFLRAAAAAAGPRAAPAAPAAAVRDGRALHASEPVAGEDGTGDAAEPPFDPADGGRPGRRL